MLLSFERNKSSKQQWLKPRFPGAIHRTLTGLSLCDFSFQEHIEPTFPGGERSKADFSVKAIETPALASELV